MQNIENEIFDTLLKLNFASFYKHFTKYKCSFKYLLCTKNCNNLREQFLFKWQQKCNIVDTFWQIVEMAKKPNHCKADYKIAATLLYFNFLDMIDALEHVYFVQCQDELNKVLLEETGTNWCNSDSGIYGIADVISHGKEEFDRAKLDVDRLYAYGQYENFMVIWCASYFEDDEPSIAEYHTILQQSLLQSE